MPPSFSTTQSVVDAIAAEFTAQGIEAEVRLGEHQLAKRKDARLGQVVIVPATAVITDPRFRSTTYPFAVRQELAVHIIAKAPKNDDPARQYGDDLAMTEALRNVFLGVASRIVPGILEGGSQVGTQVGENVYGVELVLSLSVLLDTHNTTYAPNLAPEDTAFATSCAFVGPNETVECCDESVPAP